jgi:hypothetical protein
LAAAVSGLGGAALAQTAEAAEPPARTALNERVAAVRTALSQQADAPQFAPQFAPQPSPELEAGAPDAQAPPWSNWTNWSNWPKWSKWSNWTNA